MMAYSSARRLFLTALVAVVLAVAVAPRSADAWGGGGRFFFSKTTRAEAKPTVVEPEKADATTADTNNNAAPTTAFSRPSTTAGGGGRGYGLYGRPEENYPPDYFRRGVHRNAEKLTPTTTADDVPATTAAAGMGGERARTTTFPENGNGRGRPLTPTTDVAATTTGAEEEGGRGAGGAGGDLEGGVQPYPENGSGRGRPPWYYTGFHRSGSRQQEQEQRDYGMSDTRLYQNGRYYYDVDAGRYGYGRESNPMRTRARRPDDQEEFGSGYGRPHGGGGRRGSGYGDAAAGYQQQQEQYGNEEEFGNGDMDRDTNGFQEEGQNGRYTP